MSARTYVVGLPVVIEVTDDGRVLVTVDLSEAGDAILEQSGEAGDYSPDGPVEVTLYSESQVDDDGALVDDATRQGDGAPIEVRWSL